MIIPYDQLNPDTLQSLVEEFVSRDGTDYGNKEVTLAVKVQQVVSKLKSGEAVILFSESKGLCNIVRKDML
ncbi:MULTISPECIES: YheU family protein [unclassified Neptuniibacter]|uniref:YheU family protein n=1 Tax=unclassified Neptuniibacter TaxID=2630693 RepID=UPI0025E0DA16|nr:MULTISPECIES: YheU family protein [unclassified Neptuniibacter]|tara:strand:+ start:233 stop:445 length:213 start_codon:yes stop_codon:yes gene_type:complete